MVNTPKFSSKRLLVLQAAYSFALTMGSSMLYPFFRDHFSFAQISLQSAISYFAILAILPFVRGFRVRLAIVGAIIITALRIVYTSHVDNLLELYLYAFFTGIPILFFWIPYEILYFREYDKTKHGQQSAWYFAILSVVGIVVPVSAGFIADHFGFQNLFYLTGILMVIPLVLILRLPNQQVVVTLRRSLEHLRGVTTLFIFDGLFWSIAPGLIALSLLTFTETAIEFGVVNSIVAVGALLVSLVAAQLSDRQQNRVIFIYPVNILSAILLVFLGLQKALLPFVIIFLILASLKTIAQPINNALPMDLRNDHAKLYMGRQFLISVGRVVGFGLTWLAVLTVGLFPMYIIYAVAYLFYTFFVWRALKIPFKVAGSLPLDG